MARRRPWRVVSGAGDGVRPRAEWPGCASTAALEKLEEEFEAEKTARAIDPVPKAKDDGPKEKLQAEKTGPANNPVAKPKDHGGTKS